MEDLANKQQLCYEKIVKILTNYKKDSERRKTREYLENRLTNLESLWNEFHTRNEEIKGLLDTNPQHPYFTKNFFQDVKNYYEQVITLLENKLDENMVQDQAGSSDNTKDQANQDEFALKMLKVQEETIRLLERLLQSIESELNISHSPFFYQQKLNAMQSYWNKVMLNHTELVASSLKPCTDYTTNQVYQKMEDRFHQVAIKLQEKLGATQRSEDEIKLPRLVLPIFEGDYQKWTSFHDIFLRLVHNNSRLGNAEKMHYLKTHLRKDASNLLQHLTISDANYDAAWQLLVERYNNKRKICNTQLQLLLSQTKLEHESANGIRKLHDTTKECLHALKNLGIDINSWAPIITHIVIQKLDVESHKLFEQTLEKPRELPTNEMLFKFLETRFQSLESCKDIKKKESQPAKLNKEIPKYKSYHSVSKGSNKCGFCQLSHKIYECQKFIKLPIDERQQFIRANKLCFNCLMHKYHEKCRSRYKCNTCNLPHHSLLHQEKQTKAPLTQKAALHTTSYKSEVQIKNTEIILATALVRARTSGGKWELLRALIDPGSQATFITESAAELLALPKYKAKAEVSGIGVTYSGKVRHKIITNLSPRFPSKFSIRIEALVLPQLTKLLPSQPVADQVDPDHFSNLLLADPTFHTPGPIDIIIGVDIYCSIIGKEVKKYQGGLLGQQTEFGWILSGGLAGPNKATNQITSLISHIDLDETLQKFWEIESPESIKIKPSQEDELCEHHFLNNYQRSIDGSYIVRIPFNDDITQLGESRKTALARFLQNEKRFQADRSLDAKYKNFMQEYIKLGHMLPAKFKPQEGYYLPHHAVMKRDSTTTDLRVVFNASSKTTTGLSLNDTMFTGPKLQNDLTVIIMRWRMHRYVLTADIEKMYRQIKLHPDDQKYHKVLWRASPQEAIKEYQLATVTYGTASAPFLALRTLQQLAQDEKGNYPQASQVLTTDFYVDDVLTGADTLREAKELQTQLISLLASGGFNLRKWTANQPSLLNHLPEDYLEKNIREISDGEPIKTLGLFWLPSNDCFHFRANISETTSKSTKRAVLSDISKIFDPAGWLAPVVVQAKILMQKLWSENLDWDSPLTDELLGKWNQFRHELKAIEMIKIPRWCKYSASCQQMQLHGFCDASEKAYAAVVYSRICTPQGDFVTTILIAKTKVAPIKKPATLPRLELCATVLLSQLIVRTKQALNLDNIDIYLWTDSSIALSWINNSSKKLDKFVANRVSQVLERTQASCWHHVRSEDNPADCASRGLAPLKLKNHSIW